jgi:DNA-binding transcriptional ArsR family regulator
MINLPNEALQEVASYFQALSEPTRLQILNLLRDKPHNVGQMAESCACTSANISRHLALLTERGLVSRENRGTSVYYSIADPSVYELCELVCGSIAQQFEQRQALRLPFLQAMGHAHASRAKPTKSKVASQK